MPRQEHQPRNRSWRREEAHRDGGGKMRLLSESGLALTVAGHHIRSPSSRMWYNWYPDS